MKKISIKTKMVFYIFVFFIIMAPAIAYISLNYFKTQFKYEIEKHQFLLVSRIAEELDHRIISDQDVLVELSHLITPDMIRNPKIGERFLDNRLGTKVIFDNGIYLFTPSGKIIAETAIKPCRRGLDLSYRDYIKKTLETGKPYISDPYISSQKHKHPVVMFTAPIVDGNGKMIAILSGSFDLFKHNFLGTLAEAKIGNSGYFYLTTTDRIMIMHPDKKRILTEVVPRGVNNLYDRAIEGYEGCSETTNTKGIEMLSAFKRLQTVNWILAANYPVSEAHAPLKTAEHSAWIIIAFGGGLTALIFWLITRHMISPLLSLTYQIKEIALSTDAVKKVHSGSNDEIKDLAEVFNNLMELLHTKEKELKKNSELFQTLSDFSTNWVFWRNLDGEVRYVSQACKDISGYSIAELTDSPKLFDEMVHPEDRHRWLTPVQTIDRKSSINNVEFRIITKHGDTRWINQTCRPIFDKNGSFIGSRGSNGDITEQKVAEAKIIRLSNLYAALSQSNHAIMHIKDRNKLFQEICRIAVEYGTFRLAWVGLINEETHAVEAVASCGEGVAYLQEINISIDERRENSQGPTAKAIRTGSHYICNDFFSDPHILPCREAARKYGLRASAAFPFECEGEIIGVFMVYAEEKDFFDPKLIDLLQELAANISFALDNFKGELHRKEAEDKIRRLNEELELRVVARTKQLELANKELESFSYSVSHDLRAPLRHIDGYGHLLMEDYAEQLDQKGKDYLNRMCGASRRMGDLIDALLGLSRLIKNEKPRIPVNLSGIACGLAAELKERDPDRNVDFRIAENLVVNGDHQLLRVLMGNLLANAWKYTGKEEYASIDVGIATVSGKAAYFVRDNGVGFDMKFADKLFKPFQRLHGVDEFEGNGIGLATVSRIVTLYSGRVWAESEIDKGATFYFTL